jgi:hypothetical protein
MAYADSDQELHIFWTHWIGLLSQEIRANSSESPLGTALELAWNWL